MARFTCSAVQETGRVGANGARAQASEPATRFTPAAVKLPRWICLHIQPSITAFKGRGLTVAAAHCCKDADGTSSRIWLKEKKKKLTTFALRIITPALGRVMEIRLFLNP